MVMSPNKSFKWTKIKSIFAAYRDVVSSFKLLGVFAIFYGGEALGCFTPTPGNGYDFEKLISSSQVIVLVELTDIRVEYDAIIHNKLKVVEVLKGKPENGYEFISFKADFKLETFSNHTDDLFWRSDTGRSSYGGGICGPNHIFEKGYRYLYFPDLLGAYKSAEIIETESDEWFKYVKASIK